MASKRPLSNRNFLARVRDYLPMDAAIWHLDADGHPARSALYGGLEENIFYLFDGEAVLAVNHAIEELALGEANGTLVAAFRDLKDFEPHRERYWQLAATLDKVKVLAGGKPPRRHAHLQFATFGKSKLRSFCFVLYLGRRVQALVLCREEGKAAMAEQTFAGFYTLNKDVIDRVRREIDGLMSGRSAGLPEFQRQRAIDQAAKQIQAEFEVEAASLGLALRKLQKDGQRYQSRDFLSELEKSLRRLTRLKSRLPQIIGLTEPLVCQ